MTTSITKQITTVLLRATIRDIAWPMSRARHNGELSAYGFVARFWERVGGVGENLEAVINWMLVRCDYDFDGYEF